MKLIRLLNVLCFPTAFAATCQKLAAVWCCVLLVVYVRAVEWDCSYGTNTGTFTLSSSCTMSGTGYNVMGGGVDVTNTLEIVGGNNNTDMNNLITINAATGKRHFYLNGLRHYL